MKYRRLTNEELQEIETAFVRFLASNSVTADDWVKIKTTDTEKAEGLIEMFSDIVFENTLQKIEYLEFKTAKDIKTFYCQAEKMELMGMLVDGEIDFDFRKNQSPATMLDSIRAAGGELKIYSAEKGYKDGNRTQELFEMMESGCLISDGTLFKTLKSLQK